MNDTGRIMRGSRNTAAEVELACSCSGEFNVGAVTFGGLARRRLLTEIPE